MTIEWPTKMLKLFRSAEQDGQQSFEIEQKNKRNLLLNCRADFDETQ